MTADSTILIAVKSDGTGAKIIKRDLDEIANKSDRATGQNEKFNRSLKKTDGIARSLKGAFGALFAAFSAAQIANVADQFTNLLARIENSTRSTAEFDTAFRGLARSARQTGTSLNAAVDVFQRLSFARDEIGATVDEMVQFTGTVQRLGIVSGASTQSLQAGLLQLGQGLSAGILRAEEFNSILENIPAVGKSIANEFGVTVGQLRNLVLEGEVLSEDVFAAIINQTEKANEQFDKMPLTIGRAFGQLRNDIGLTIAGIDSSTDATQALAQSISGLGAISIGLGKTFSGLFNFLTGGISTVATVIFGILEGVTKSINFVISGINRLPGVNIGQIELSQTLEDLRRGSQQSAIESFSSGASNFASIFERQEIKEVATQTREISKNYADIAEGISGANDETEKIRKALEKVSKKTKELKDDFDDLGGGIVDAFRRGFEQGDGFIDRFINGAKNAFNNLFADIARLAARPITMNIGAAITGGAAGQGASSLLGAGSSGFGNIGSLLSNGLSGLTTGLSTPIFSAGSTIGGAINSIGGSLGLTNANFIGPSLPGASTLSSAFTPGAALGGFGGNLLANSLFGDRGIGASIGGFAGGAVGTAVGASTLGASLGAFGGPVGALAGSFLGNALGGLFGGSKPSDKAQLSGINLATLQTRQSGQTGSKFSQENRDFADKVIGEAGQLASLLKDAGATLEGSLSVVVGNRDGLRIGGYLGRNFGNNTEAFLNAVADSVIASIADAPEDLKTVLQNVGGFDTASIAEAVGILELVRSFEDAGESAKPLQDAINALDSQFTELRNKAVDLGLPVDKLTESYEKQKDAIIADVLSPLQDFLDNQSLSQDSTLSPIERLALARSQFDKNLSNIQSGDFSGLGDITGQASTLLNIGRDVFASGEGFASLESFVRQSIAGIAGDLGAPGAIDVNREIALSTAKQTSIQEQMLLELRELRAENVRQRKLLERESNKAAV